METIKGISVYQHIGFGKLFFIDHKQEEIKDMLIQNIDEELEKFNKSKDQAIEELQLLYDRILLENGEEAAQIFEVHQMMLQDDDYLDAIRLIIKKKKTAEFAIYKTSESLQASFLSIEDEYLRARAADVKDISQRLLNILSKKTVVLPKDNSKYIIVCDDLLPSETLHLDMNQITGIVMFEGSMNSHAAILARMKEIPTIIKTKRIDKIYENSEAIINSVNGFLYINPDINTAEKMQSTYEILNKKQQVLSALKHKKTVTKDGVKLQVMANISHHKDIDLVIEKGAEGVGLFRTEFLFINQDTYPTEEEQFEEYKKVLSLMENKKVIIRTMDIGTDKTADYFELPNEANPALGYRAIRISLDRPEVLCTQLSALLRASKFGKLGIMFPMITSVWEIQALKKHLFGVEKKLKAKGIEVGQYEIGIMIETPAAALISDELAKEVDFFSVGTNDLTQYTLAVDRQNTLVEQYENPQHKAVLRLIAMASKNIHKYPDKWIGICGELGSNLNLTTFFVGIGIDELSVSSTYILPLREKILSIDKNECQQVVDDILNTSNNGGRHERFSKSENDHI